MDEFTVKLVKQAVQVTLLTTYLTYDTDGEKELLCIFDSKLTPRLTNIMLNDRVLQVIVGSEITNPRKYKMAETTSAKLSIEEVEETLIKTSYEKFF